MDEMEVALQFSKSGKSSKLDDLIVKVLWGSLDWIKEECLKMIHAFWVNGIMTICALRGVT